eukprot:m.223380 g.223380  ORF g.223380 m.223380 type:complete len:316 (+) comp15942_c0_seq20:141-1088(+)
MASIQERVCGLQEVICTIDDEVKSCSQRLQDLNQRLRKLATPQTPQQQTVFPMQPVGFIASCFSQKFGIPRQPGLAPLARGEMRFVTPWNHPDGVRGLEGWSHVWIIFIFHKIPEQDPKKFKAAVYPPRGDKKHGVFATRSTHRPNRIGLSVVELEGIEYRSSGPVLLLKGVDLLDGTPVLDIKPYLKYSDALPQALSSFAQHEPHLVPVEINADVEKKVRIHDIYVFFLPLFELDTQLQELKPKHPEYMSLVKQVLAQDPRPTYYKREGAPKHDGKFHYSQLCEFQLQWVHEDGHVTVTGVSTLPQSEIPVMFR